MPFLRSPPLSAEPIPMPSYAPTSIKGAALEEVTLALIAKGAVELAPLPSPGFYSRLFVVWKTSGSWQPVIDLFLLNRFMNVSHFRVETIQSVLLSVRQGNWMASIDLREAYLQVPVHPESRRFLRFVAHGRTYQFTALCFGLSTAPQVFTRVMAPVSAILHTLGIRMRRAASFGGCWGGSTALPKTQVPPPPKPQLAPHILQAPRSNSSWFSIIPTKIQIFFFLVTETGP